MADFIPNQRKSHASNAELRSNFTQA